MNAACDLPCQLSLWLNLSKIFTFNFNQVGVEAYLKGMCIGRLCQYDLRINITKLKRQFINDYLLAFEI